MKRGRQGGLIAIGHFLVWSRETEELGRLWKARAGHWAFSIVSQEEYQYHPLFRSTTVFLANSCQRTISAETSEYIVSLLLPWLCTILVQVLGCVHACVAPLCSLGMLNTSFAQHSCSLISYLLLPAAGSVSILRLRYRPNQPS